MMKPNIILKENFVVEHNALFDFMFRNTQWNESFKSRKTASFGVPYEYSGINYPKLAMPEQLQQIAHEIEETFNFMPNNCLINYYENGQSSMGFHSDDTSQMATATGVVIISLGAVRNIYYRLKSDKNHTTSYPLLAGGLLYMDDNVQSEWLHAILKDETTEPRMSLTFRLLTV